MADAAKFAKGQLRSLAERIEKLQEEKQIIADDIKEVYAEAKSAGFDVKALRAVIRLRAQDADERAEHQALVELYSDALGLGGTPLAESAMERSLTPHKGKAGKARRQTGGEDTPGAKAAREFQRAMGTPVDLTEEEKAQGYAAAYRGKDGNRVAVKIGMSEDDIRAAADRAANGPKQPSISERAVQAAADRAEETAGT
jgi:uncharacterized protein (UPF0335 family)